MQCLHRSPPKWHRSSHVSCSIMDIVSKAVRSRMMAAIRGSNTRPELVVRGAMHKAGLRFRLHRHDLPGTPDLVFSSPPSGGVRAWMLLASALGLRERARLPATNAKWWLAKLRDNQRRDRRQQRKLLAAGWRVLVVWECQLADARTLRELEHKIRRRRARS